MSKEWVFYQTGEHACSYLPDRQARTIFLDPKYNAIAETLEILNLQGFRRSGKHIYRPECDDCKRCESVRVKVSEFVWTRSFKRNLRKNDDVQLTIHPLTFNQAHYDLFEDYINKRHRDGDMYPTSQEQYEQFLLQGFTNSYILEFRRNNQLIGCSVIDHLATGLSALYTWFDVSEEKNGIGTLAILHMIQLAARLQLPYVYLGFWIADSPKMAYKSRFKPLQTFKNEQWSEKID